MSNDLDILIRRATTRHSQVPVDIAVQGGRIAQIGPDTRRSAGVEIDAGAGLVTESFVKPHLHLDKVYSLNRLDEQALRACHAADTGKAMSAIELAGRVKAEYQEDWILEALREHAALRAVISHGRLLKAAG